MTLITKSIEILGSHIEIMLADKHADVIKVCFAELRRIDDTYSRFKASSIISQLNAHLHVWRPASDELLFLLDWARQLHEKTDGHFDITIKSDLERLGYDANYSFRRTQSDDNSTSEPRHNTALTWIRKVLGIHAHEGQQPTLDFARKRVKVHKQIEIGGFGKGFALDRIAAIMDANGVDHYFINAGGDIFARRGARKPAWDVLLEHPDDTTRAIGKIQLDRMAIACSAPNRRKWKTPSGEEFHHLINAKTRLPERSVKSIFVLANTGLEADGYATALFTAGFERAVRLAAAMPVKVLLISAQNKMYRSPQWDIELFD